jgi:hypothetical protein
MTPERMTEVCAQAVAFGKKCRTWAGRVPATAWVALGLFLLAAVFTALHTVYGRRDASLRLRVQHSLRSAQLSVWVDGDLAYSGKIVGSTRKRFGLIESIQGSLSETLPVSSGTHQVRVRVVSDDGTAQENTITGEFDRNSQRTLSVTARRDDVSLNWQGTGTAVSEAAASSSGWLGHYASTLLLTLAGSIMSALAGYAIRELPKQIASRQDAVPKV